MKISKDLKILIILVLVCTTQSSFSFNLNQGDGTIIKTGDFSSVSTKKGWKINPRITRKGNLLFFSLQQTGKNLIELHIFNLDTNSVVKSSVVTTELMSYHHEFRNGFVHSFAYAFNYIDKFFVFELDTAHESVKMIFKKYTFSAPNTYDIIDDPDFAAYTTNIAVDNNFTGTILAGNTGDPKILILDTVYVTNTKKIALLTVHRGDLSGEGKKFFSKISIIDLDQIPTLHSNDNKIYSQQKVFLVLDTYSVQTFTNTKLFNYEDGLVFFISRKAKNASKLTFVFMNISTGVGEEFDFDNTETLSDHYSYDFAIINGKKIVVIAYNNRDDKDQLKKIDITDRNNIFQTGVNAIRNTGSHYGYRGCRWINSFVHLSSISLSTTGFVYMFTSTDPTKTDGGVYVDYTNFLNLNTSYKEIFGDLAIVDNNDTNNTVRIFIISNRDTILNMVFYELKPDTAGNTYFFKLVKNGTTYNRITCLPPYFWDLTSQECQTCPANTYYSNNTCTACPNQDLSGDCEDPNNLRVNNPMKYVLHPDYGKRNSCKLENKLYDSEGICYKCSDIGMLNLKGFCTSSCPGLASKGICHVTNCRDPSETYIEDFSCKAQCSENYELDSNVKVCNACLANQYFDLADKTCIAVCDSSRKINEVKKQCCENVILADTCVDICPCGTSENNNKECIGTTCAGSTLLCDENTCVSVCPEYKVLSANNCLSCSGNTSFINITVSPKVCVNICPTGLKINDSPKYCSNCPSTSPYYDITANNCVAVCPANYKIEESNKTCINCFATTSTQFFDTETNTCVSACSQFKVISGNSCLSCSGNTSFINIAVSPKVCLNICPIGLKININGSLKYCSKCSGTSPYYDITANDCVAVCPANYKIEESNKTCINCFATTNTQFFDTETNTCVSACSQFKVISGNSCLSCSGNTSFINIAVSPKVCLNICPIGLKININGSLKYCSKCSGTSPYYDKTANDCVAVCPANYKIEESNKTCINCFETTSTRFFDTETNTCVSACSEYKILSGNSCLNCSGNTSFINIAVSPKVCLNICPIGLKININGSLKYCSKCSGTSPYYDKTSNDCVAACPANYKIEESNKTCINCFATTNTQFFDTETNTCVSVCSEFKVVSGNSCLSCSGNTSFINIAVSPKVCLNICPTGLKINDSPKYCTNCPSTSPYYDKTTNDCVAVCPANYKIEESNKTCINCAQTTNTQFFDTETNTCVSACSEYKILSGNSCLSCSGNTSFINIAVSPKVCLNICPTGLKININGSLKYCSKCSGTSPYYDKTANDCVAVCPANYKIEESNKTCINCFETTSTRFFDTETNTCVSACSEFKVVSGNSCLSCSGNTSFINIAVSPKVCLNICPVGLNVNISGSLKYCSKCSGISPYYDITANDCVAVCPANYKIEESNKTCINCFETTNTQFFDTETNTCVSACSQFKVISANSCLSCSGEYFIYKYSC